MSIIIPNIENNIIKIDDIEQNISIHQLYDITKNYKSRIFIKNIIIPDIKYKISNSIYENIYKYFNQPLIQEYNRIFKICKKKNFVYSYINLYYIFYDIIINNNERYNKYFYITSDYYDILNYSLVKCCEKYFINKVKSLNFELENLACKYKLKLLLGKYYFYNVIFNSLIIDILTNKINNFDEIADIIDNEVKCVDLTELIINFLPPCEDDDNEDDDKESIYYDIKYDSDLLINSDIEDFN